MLEAELVKMNPDIGAIEDFRAKLADYEKRAEELDAVTAERDEVCCVCSKLYVHLKYRPCLYVCMRI